jgi:hypothetical protein
MAGLVNRLAPGRGPAIGRDIRGSAYYDAASDQPFAPFSLPQLQQRADQASRLYLPHTVDSIGGLSCGGLLAGFLCQIADEVVARSPAG